MAGGGVPEVGSVGVEVGWIVGETGLSTESMADEGVLRVGSTGIEVGWGVGERVGIGVFLGLGTQAFKIETGFC